MGLDKRYIIIGIAVLIGVFLLLLFINYLPTLAISGNPCPTQGEYECETGSKDKVLVCSSNNKWTFDKYCAEASGGDWSWCINGEKIDSGCTDVPITDPKPDCLDGDQKCDGGSIYKCSNHQWQLDYNCESGECAPDTDECIAPEPEPEIDYEYHYHCKRVNDDYPPSKAVAEADIWLTEIYDSEGNTNGPYKNYAKIKVQCSGETGKNADTVLYMKRACQNCGWADINFECDSSGCYNYDKKFPEGTNTITLRDEPGDMKSVFFKCWNWDFNKEYYDSGYAWSTDWCFRGFGFWGGWKRNLEVVGCDVGWMDEYRCSGNWRQRKYRKEDCSTEWRDYQQCEVCSNGRCVGCVDTDGGKDYQTKGTLTAGDITETDFCNGDVLTEFYCAGNEYCTTQYICEQGCIDGACVPATGVNVIIDFFDVVVKALTGG